jgi:tetratricopeptide (TPR) repeat protein
MKMSLPGRDDLRVVPGPKNYLACQTGVTRWTGQSRSLPRKFVTSILLVLLTTSTHADSLRLKSGQENKGTIKSFDGQKLTIQVSIGGGTAELPYDINLIEQIRFDRTPEEEKILAGTDLVALEAFWKKRLPYLSYPESDTGEIAQKYIQALLAKKTKVAGKTALDICELVLKRDWKPERRETLQNLRLQALIQAGKTEAAMAEAEKAGDLSTDNAAALVDAKFVLAQGADQKRRDLEKQHPRWNEEKKITAERRLLINQALDQYLLPVVFFAELRAPCARGLWYAAELYRSLGENDQALVRAHEIVEQFPEPDYLSKAQELIKQLEKKEKTKEKS